MTSSHNASPPVSDSKAHKKTNSTSTPTTNILPNNRSCTSSPFTEPDIWMKSPSVAGNSIKIKETANSLSLNTSTPSTPSTINSSLTPITWTLADFKTPTFVHTYTANDLSNFALLKRINQYFLEESTLTADEKKCQAVLTPLIEFHTKYVEYQKERPKDEKRNTDLASLMQYDEAFIKKDTKEANLQKPQEKLQAKIARLDELYLYLFKSPYLKTYESLDQKNIASTVQLDLFLNINELDLLLKVLNQSIARSKHLIGAWKINRDNTIVKEINGIPAYRVKPCMPTDLSYKANPEITPTKIKTYYAPNDLTPGSRYNFEKTYNKSLFLIIKDRKFHIYNDEIQKHLINNSQNGGISPKSSILANGTFAYVMEQDQQTSELEIRMVDDTSGAHSSMITRGGTTPAKCIIAAGQLYFKDGKFIGWADQSSSYSYGTLQNAKALAAFFSVFDHSFFPENTFTNGFTTSALLDLFKGEYKYQKFNILKVDNGKYEFTVPGFEDDANQKKYEDTVEYAIGTGVAEITNSTGKTIVNRWYSMAYCLNDSDNPHVVQTWESLNQEPPKHEVIKWLATFYSCDPKDIGPYSTFPSTASKNPLTPAINTRVLHAALSRKNSVSSNSLNSPATLSSPSSTEFSSFMLPASSFSSSNSSLDSKHSSPYPDINMSPLLLGTTSIVATTNQNTIFHKAPLPASPPKKEKLRQSTSNLVAADPDAQPTASARTQIYEQQSPPRLFSPGK